ncbi:hypothetical protein [Sinomonas sp. G460-2]|uniref:hypothetical protein n=1 Tax=Sinomonas sp. G460-2 TaxID=3393464 RepID=UPI0039F0F571
MSNPQHQPDQNPWPPAQSEWPSSAPWPAGQPVLYPGEGPLGLTPRDADRSRSRRTQIGWISLVLAIFNFAAAALFAVVLASNYTGRYSDLISNGSVIVSAVAGVIYLGLGIWSLATRRTTAAAPMVFSLVFSGLALVLGLIGLVGAIVEGGSPQFVGLILELWVVMRAAQVLRTRPVPAPYGAPVR